MVTVKYKIGKVQDVEREGMHKPSHIAKYHYYHHHQNQQCDAAILGSLGQPPGSATCTVSQVLCENDAADGRGLVDDGLGRASARVVQQRR